MAKISLASKVAIAFIRPFRSYLDGRVLIKESRKQIEDDLKDRMEDFAAKAKKQNPNINEKRIEYAKDCLIAVNMQMINAYEPSYVKILPNVIEELTIALETELKKDFTPAELAEVVEAVEKPAMQKLLANIMLFGVLKKCEMELEHKLRMEVFESSLGSQSLNNMKDAFNNLKKQHDIRDEDVDELEDNEDPEY